MNTDLLGWLKLWPLRVSSGHTWPKRCYWMEGEDKSGPKWLLLVRQPSFWNLPTALCRAGIHRAFISDGLLMFVVAVIKHKFSGAKRILKVTQCRSDMILPSISFLKLVYVYGDQFTHLANAVRWRPISAKIYPVGDHQKIFLTPGLVF